jgi:hypothetical protein
MRAAGRVLAIVVPALVAAGAAPAGAGAQWHTEALPAAAFVSPLGLAFDAGGRGLLSWEGFSQPPPRSFTGLAVRDPRGGWRRAPDLPGINWGATDIHLYGRDRAVLVAGRPATAGTGLGARYELLYALGHSDGTFGAPRVLTGHCSPGTKVSASNARGDTLVAWTDDRSGATRLRERRPGARFGATQTLAPTGSPAAAALNARGDGVLAWWARDGIRARVRRGGAWGRALLAAPGANRESYGFVRAAVGPDGRIVLAWQSADVTESHPVVLRAGVAVRDGAGRWRAHRLEAATVRSSSGIPEGTAAIPLIDSGGRSYVTWTAVRDGELVVKLARLPRTGFGEPTLLSGPLRGAAVDDAATGADGELLVA